MYPPGSNLPAHSPLTGPPTTASILLTSTDEVPGYRVIRVFGLVKGNTVRARNIGRDIVAGLRSIVGGEVVEYTKMLAQSREQALDRLKAQAFRMGANAVVGGVADAARYAFSAGANLFSASATATATVPRAFRAAVGPTAAVVTILRAGGVWTTPNAAATGATGLQR